MSTTTTDETTTDSALALRAQINAARAEEDARRRQFAAEIDASRSALAGVREELATIAAANPEPATIAISYVYFDGVTVEVFGHLADEYTTTVSGTVTVPPSTTPEEVREAWEDALGKLNPNDPEAFLPDAVEIESAYYADHEDDALVSTPVEALDVEAQGL